MLEAKPNEIFILNRTLSKAEEIVEIYINNTTKITAGPLNEKLPFKSDGIINTTSAGLLGQEIVCPENLFSDQAWCYDLNYADVTTNFNKLAKKNKISKAYDGMGMLLRQAALSFEIWTDLIPDVDKAIEMLKK